MTQEQANPNRSPDPELVSVTMQLSRRDIAMLAELADRLQVPPDEVVRKAIATYKVIQDHSQADSQLVVTQKGNTGNIRGVIVPA